MNIDNPTLLRLLDANLNRAVEGLRVLEECARMLLNDKALTGRIKSLRHKTAAVIRSHPSLDSAMLFARDTDADVLHAGATSSELIRDDVVSLLRANAKRAAEAIRALEEYGKFVSPDLAVACKDIRFAVYALEQDIVAASTRSALVASDRIRLGLAIDCSLEEQHVDECIQAIRESGAGLVVLRAGTLSDRLFSDRMAYISDSVDRSTVTVIVDGRADIALAAGVDGAVLSCDTLSPAACRKILGPGLVIGFVPVVRNGGITDIDHAPDPAIDLLLLPEGGDLPGGSWADQMKPRILTGVQEVETLRSLPSDQYDGVLLEPSKPVIDRCIAAKAITAGWHSPAMQ